LQAKLIPLVVDLPRHHRRIRADHVVIDRHTYRSSLGIPVELQVSIDYIHRRGCICGKRQQAVDGDGLLSGARLMRETCHRRPGGLLCVNTISVRLGGDRENVGP
jgi:hypothetical protein